MCFVLFASKCFKFVQLLITTVIRTHSPLSAMLEQTNLKRKIFLVTTLAKNLTCDRTQAELM